MKQISPIKYIKSGKLGSISSISTLFSYNNKNPKNIRNIKKFGGGAIYDIGCYPTVISRYLLGKEPFFFEFVFRYLPISLINSLDV